MFQVALPLDPMGRPRERHRIVSPRDGRPQFVQSYTPEGGDYGKWRVAAKLVMQAARRGAPMLEGPLALRVVALFPMPTGEHRKREPRPRRWHTAKPDLDNILKAVMDVAVEAGWMRDDAPIAQIEAQKIVAEQGARGAVHVTLLRLPPMVLPSLEPTGGELFREVGEDGMQGFVEPLPVPELVRYGKCARCGCAAEWDDKAGMYAHVPGARGDAYSEQAWGIANGLNAHHTAEVL